jgi:hypothetical protein
MFEDLTTQQLLALVAFVSLVAVGIYWYINRNTSNNGEGFNLDAHIEKGDNDTMMNVEPYGDEKAQAPICNENGVCSVEHENEKSDTMDSINAKYADDENDAINIEQMQHNGPPLVFP